jgi:FkbM family methyltransferase
MSSVLKKLANSRGVFGIVLNCYWRPLFQLARRLQFLWYRKKDDCLFRMSSVYALFQTRPSYERSVQRWIRSLERGNVLWDVGANIGIHAIVAGRRGVRTFAFEPAASNFYELVRNIDINRVNGEVTPVPFALSNARGTDVLHLNTVVPGSSWNNLGEATTYGHGKDDRNMFKQMVYATSIDDLVASGFEIPNYLKVDVDGLEAQIIEGARQTLASGSVEMIMLEMAERTKARHNDMYDQLRAWGYTPYVAREEAGRWRDVLWVQNTAAMPDALSEAFEELPDPGLLMAR